MDSVLYFVAFGIIMLLFLWYNNRSKPRERMKEYPYYDKIQGKYIHPPKRR